MEQNGRTLDQAMAYHCAPALVGIKPADLFSWPLAREEEIRCCQRALAGRGIQMRVLRRRRRQLILVYRPERLERCLGCPRVRQLLARAGYPAEAGLEELLRHLMERIGEAEDFPHEIGLFLGYPPDDVEGFCRNRGQNDKYCGCWKVYGDVEGAKRYFARCDRCREALCRRVGAGKTIAELFPTS